MGDLGASFSEAARLIVSLDANLVEVVGRSLWISVAAVLAASIIALPLGASVAVFRFPGRRAAIILLNAFMGLPPVVVGLAVYIVLSRSGPLGALGLLFTPSAMVTAQTILVLPIVAAMTHQVTRDLYVGYAEQLQSLGAGPGRALWTLLWEGRLSLATAMLAGFGRASAEVGAVLIVGGNIAHVTRVMTTTIALETSKGNIALALGLGIVLLAIAVGVNAAVMLLSEATQPRRA